MEWWRDILLIKHGLTEEVTNTEWSGSLRAVAENLEARVALAAAESTEATASALGANATPRLALEVFVLDLPTVPEDAVPRPEEASASEGDEAGELE
jgi:hypothetical protein